MTSTSTAPAVVKSRFSDQRRPSHLFQKPIIKTELDIGKHDNETSTTSPNEQVKESLRLIEDLKFFLATAPANWQENQVIRRYYLNQNEGFVSCVYWNNLYFITGTDIVRCIVYKFEHFGRKIIDRKKFEEGIFSDLRNLKCDQDAILEPPRSDFLEFLFKNACLRTQKKQKVFFWFNVPHDKLMADALERDFKKEKLGQPPTTIADREPALSFKYDEDKSLYDQLAQHIDWQKKLNDASEEDDDDMTATAQAPFSSYADLPNELGDSNKKDTQEDDSPEYISSHNNNNNNSKVNHPNQEGFDFLDQDTPANYKASSDYEDDFPLDYFDPERVAAAAATASGSGTAEVDYSHDFITLGNDIHTAYMNGLDDNYDTLVDPTIFTNPIAPTPSANQLVFNEDYLIEQTQPLKTPLATQFSQKQQLQSTSHLQSSHSLPTATQYVTAPAASFLPSASQEHFAVPEIYPPPPAPGPPGPSARQIIIQQGGHPHQPQPQQQPQQQPPYSQQYYPDYNYMQTLPPDQELWAASLPAAPIPSAATASSSFMPGPPSAGPGQQSFYASEPHMAQQAPYLYYNDSGYQQPQQEFLSSSNGQKFYHYAEPAAVPTAATSSAGQAYMAFAPPSSRQQQISANMMRKKRQLQSQARVRHQQGTGGRVSKPTTTYTTPSAPSLEEVIANKNNNRSVSFKDSQSHGMSKGVNGSGNEIPTPESSIGHR